MASAAFVFVHRNVSKMQCHTYIYIYRLMQYKVMECRATNVSTHDTSPERRVPVNGCDRAVATAPVPRLPGAMTLMPQELKQLPRETCHQRLSLEELSVRGGSVFGVRWGPGPRPCAQATELVFGVFG